MTGYPKMPAGLAAFAMFAATAPLAAQEQPQQSAPAAAQQAQPQRPQGVNRFEDMTIRMLLEDVGTSVQVLPSETGVTRYRASTQNGITFTAFPAACSEQMGCVGLVTVAIFDQVEVPAGASLDTFLHRFNDANPSAKVFRGPQGNVVLQAYINAANVISYANAQSQLLVFGQDIVRTSQALRAFQNGE